MSTEANKALARRLYAAVGEVVRTGNVDLLDDIVAVDAVDHDPAPGQKPGLAGIKAGFAELAAAMPDFAFTVEDMVAEGDKVAVRLTNRGTHRGALLGVAPTGKVLTQRGIDLLRFEGGKLVERWGIFDDAGLLRQLGLMG